MSLIRFGHTIPEFVKKLREDRSLTQAELAKSLGYHVNQVSNVEIGLHKSPLAFCLRLKKYLKDKEREKILDDLIENALQENLSDRFGKTLERNLEKRKLKRAAK